MTKQEKIELIQKLQRRLEKANKSMEMMYAVFGRNPEGPFQDGIYGLFDMAIDGVAKAIGDDSDWLSWFIYDNDWGKKGYEAGYKPMVKVKSIEDFVTMMEMTEGING